MVGSSTTDKALTTSLIGALVVAVSMTYLLCFVSYVRMMRIEVYYVKSVKVNRRVLHAQETEQWLIVYMF